MENSIDIKNKEALIGKAKMINWEHWVDRPYSPFVFTLNMTMVTHASYDQIGLSDTGFGYETSLYQYPIFYYSKALEEKNTKALENYLAKKTIFDLSASLEKLHERNKLTVSGLVASPLSAIEKLSKAREVLRTYAPFLWLNISLEKHFQKLIDTEFPKYITGDLKQFVSEVSMSPKKNSYTLMLDMLETDTPIELVHKQFAWMKSRDGFTDFYTITELEEIKKNHKKEPSSKPIIPNALKELVAELQELTFLRTSRTDKMYEMLGLVRPIFKEVAETIGVSFKELQDYDVDLILSGGVLQKITKPYSCLYIDGIQIIQSDKFISFDMNMRGVVSASSNTRTNGHAPVGIKGLSAFRGIVRGFVRIVRHPDDLSKVQVGDVLVAQMTLPSFISAMQKTVAFVTDEGGITCHAAIIAREMKKPCIIGTKIATKIFKDGDMVEVDAERGIVKIINH